MSPGVRAPLTKAAASPLNDEALCACNNNEREACGSQPLQRYCNQVGGHCAILKPQGTGFIYKPLCESELRFYEDVSRLSKRSDIDNPLRPLLSFIPRFHGIGTVSVQTTAPGPTSPVAGAASQYLILEDLLSGYRKPCIIDIKLGRLQRTLGATPEKLRRQLEKSLKTTSNALGFRLCGMQSYNAKSDAIIYRDKYWGRKLKRDRIDTALKEWFSNGICCHYDLVHMIYLKITSLIRAIREVKSYRFWSSSLLWFYDGAYMEAEKRRKTLDLRLIDFANVIRLPDNPTPDMDMLLGLENLAKFLANLIPGGVQPPVRYLKLGGATHRRSEYRVSRRWRRRCRFPTSEIANPQGGDDGDDDDENAVMSEDDFSSDAPMKHSSYVRVRQWSRWQTTTTFDLNRDVPSASVPLDHISPSYRLMQAYEGS
eukprot:Gregarina_sp_Pseudo_9__3598@NODE_375_length_3014_cov_10_087731_g354_i0_p2_GENE_NODE_375_length_3014_cov_10_087731_g354_i0NODE_375_length_3014_cov_10_087731_g354_i0_p2_ORF_typecomplete_len447_score41_70IPK/PF03770_16/7_9e49_NODE_375_length_3014_cov_10_087731_g354_i016742954